MTEWECEKCGFSWPYANDPECLRCEPLEAAMQIMIDWRMYFRGRTVRAPILVTDEWIAQRDDQGAGISSKGE